MTSFLSPGCGEGASGELFLDTPVPDTGAALAWQITGVLITGLYLSNGCVLGSGKVTLMSPCFKGLPLAFLSSFRVGIPRKGSLSMASVGI